MLKCNNFAFLNHKVANESVEEILQKISENVSKKSEEKYIENNKLMRTLRIAIRDSKNINRKSKY